MLSLALVTSAEAARGENVVGGKPIVDLLDRATRLQAAANRIEELDQTGWKSISSEGDLDAAVAAMSEAADLARTAFGEEHWLTKLRDTLAAGVKSLAGLSPVKKQQAIEAIESQSRWNLAWPDGNRERCLSKLRQAQEKIDQVLGPDHLLSTYSLLGLANHECELGEFRSAQVHASRAVTVLKPTWGDQNPGFAHSLYALAMTEVGLKELESAELHFREAARILESVAREGISGPYLHMYAGTQLFLARMLNDQERFADAESFARRGTEIHGFSPRQTYTNYLEGQLDLARSLSGQGKIEEAEILFSCLVKVVIPNAPPHVLANILGRYTEHLRRNHRDAEADQIESRLRKLSARSERPQ
jgi:hypothetical protein